MHVLTVVSAVIDPAEDGRLVGGEPRLQIFDVAAEHVAGQDDYASG